MNSNNNSHDQTNNLATAVATPVIATTTTTCGAANPEAAITMITPRFHSLVGVGGRGLGGRGGGRGGRSCLLVKEASRRSMVKSDSVSKLKVEMNLATKQEAPQALAIPIDWKKEDAEMTNLLMKTPPCEIIFDSSVELSLCYDSDLDSLDGGLVDSSLDSVAGSSCPGDNDDESLSVPTSPTNNSSIAAEQEEEEEEEEGKAQQPQETEVREGEGGGGGGGGGGELKTTPINGELEEEQQQEISISDAELTRQIRAVQVNPSPSRVQGICRQWHKTMCASSENGDDDQTSVLCDNNEFSTRLLHRGGMEALLDAMIMQKDFPEVQEAICWVLGLLLISSENNNNNKEPKNEGETPAEEEDQEEENFDDSNTNNGINACKEWFVECSGVQSILQAMQSYKRNPWVQEAACWALFGLTYNNNNNNNNINSTTNNSAIQTLVEELGAKQAVLDAMKKHPNVSGVQEQACALIANLQQLPKTTATAAAATSSDDDITSAVLSAMENHLQEPGVQEYGCKALGNLLLTTTTTACGVKEENFDITTTTTTTNNILRAIGTAMSTHPSNADVLESSLRALLLHTMSSSSDNHLVDLQMMLKDALSPSSTMEFNSTAAAGGNSDSSGGYSTATREEEEGGLSCYLQELMIQHPRLRETGNKLLHTLQRQRQRQRQRQQD